MVFEPNPNTVMKLRANLAVSDIGNVTVSPSAWTDPEQFLVLYASPALNAGMSSISERNAALPLAEQPEAFTICGRAVDSVVGELGLPAQESCGWEVGRLHRHA